MSKSCQKIVEDEAKSVICARASPPRARVMVALHPVAYPLYSFEDCATDRDSKTRRPAKDSNFSLFPKAPSHVRNYVQRWMRIEFSLSFHCPLLLLLLPRVLRSALLPFSDVIAKSHDDVRVAGIGWGGRDGGREKEGRYTHSLTHDFRVESAWRACRTGGRRDLEDNGTPPMAPTDKHKTEQTDTATN